MADTSDQDRIRRKAHEIWESEGRPHGRDQDHWVQAREIVALQDSMGETLLPRTTGAEEPVEPTQAVENLGDIPSLTDQGEHALTDTDREPEITKPSHAVTSLEQGAGSAASRPATPATPDGGEPKPSAAARPKSPPVAKAKTASTPTDASPSPVDDVAAQTRAQPKGVRPASAVKSPKPGPAAKR